MNYVMTLIQPYPNLRYDLQLRYNPNHYVAHNICSCNYLMTYITS